MGFSIDIAVLSSVVSWEVLMYLAITRSRIRLAHSLDYADSNDSS